jgi:hypothetical protein
MDPAARTRFTLQAFVVVLAITAVSWAAAAHYRGLADSGFREADRLTEEGRTAEAIGVLRALDDEVQLAINLGYIATFGLAASAVAGALVAYFWHGERTAATGA